MSSGTNIPFPASDPAFLERFRNAAAGLLKDFIVARLKQQPDFLSDEECRTWKIDKGALGPRTCEFCLGMAKVHLDRFLREFAGYGDSIPSPKAGENVELEILRENIATFVDRAKLDTAIGQARHHRRINWKGLARWELLPIIRKGLNALPARTGKTSEVPPSSDGPFPPDGFQYGGRIESIGRTKVWKLINHLWVRRNRTSTIRELAGPVWDDESMVVEKSRLGSLRRDANSFFENCGWPFRVTIKGDYVSIVGPDAHV
jgi:hypothetical protein